MINDIEFKQLLTNFALDNNNPEINFALGCYYKDIKQFSSAGSYFIRTAERSDDDLLIYESLIHLATCLMSLGRRRYSSKAVLSFAISHSPNRPEAYYLMSKHIEDTENNEEKWFTSYTYASTGLHVCDFDNLTSLRKETIYHDKYSLMHQKAHAGFNTGFIEEAREIFHHIVDANDAPQSIRKLSLNNLMNIKKENDRSSYYHKASNLADVYSSSLAKYAISNGGSIHPIIVPSSITQGKATTNASIFVDKDQEIYVNLRLTNYTLYYSNKFPDEKGPLKYLYPDNDINIRSENILCKLDKDLNVVNSNKIEMKLDEEPNWFYIGLEDARLFEWNNKKYICGVRRDHILEGKGRMDLSEIEIFDDKVVEVKRFSIPTPDNVESYCEKNWVPILDNPYHWIKWTNPTQVVSFDLKTLHTSTVKLDENKVYKFPRDLKGGSQVIKWKDDYYLTITHESTYNQHDTGRRYYQRIVVWDKNWNIVCSTREFTMMGGTIEFVTGISYYKDDVLISYGYEDNAAFILRIPKDIFDDFVLRG